jgi:hypothetical protein
MSFHEPQEAFFQNPGGEVSKIGLKRKRDKDVMRQDPCFSVKAFQIRPEESVDEGQKRRVLRVQEMARVIKEEAVQFYCGGQPTDMVTLFINSIFDAFLLGMKTRA